MDIITSVYVLTGFLGSGKTTLLSHLLARRQNRKILVLQFEDGEEDLEISDRQAPFITQRSYSKAQLDTEYPHILTQITEEIELGDYEELWIEWNGMEPFSRLEKILLQRQLSLFLRIKKVICLADAPDANLLLGQTGAGPLSQIAASDDFFYRNAGDPHIKNQLRQKVKSIAPSLSFRPFSEKQLRLELQKKLIPPVPGWFIFAFLAGIAALSFPLLDLLGIPAMNTAMLFLGVFLQAVPFLLLGILLSCAIQVFLPEKYLLRIFPKKTLPAMLTAIIAGFFLPVCDCASVPVFKSLIKKGVPLPAAVCFLTASPVINPIVILSTYYAYGGSIKTVFLRCGTGILCSFFIGLTFCLKKPEDFFKADSSIGTFCSCGCYLPSSEKNGIAGKFSSFLIHARTEFYTVSRYLLFGIAVSCVFQLLNLNRLASLGGRSLPASLFFMILLAFLLSLCSSSDAVVARSLSGTSGFIPMLGFLVFGPMMDVKNVILLHSYFKNRFIIRLVLTVFLVCYLVLLLFGIFTGDVMI